MLNPKELQNYYLTFYKQMRKYIWDYSTVDVLADIEVETFRAFPDVHKVRKLVTKLRSMIRDIIADDKDLHKAIDSFLDILDEGEESYSKINQVREVVQV